MFSYAVLSKLQDQLIDKAKNLYMVDDEIERISEKLSKMIEHQKDSYQNFVEMRNRFNKIKNRINKEYIKGEETFQLEFVFSLSKAIDDIETFIESFDRYYEAARVAGVTEIHELAQSHDDKIQLECDRQVIQEACDFLSQLKELMKEKQAKEINKFNELKELVKSIIINVEDDDEDEEW